jgi:hypothetical protein
VHHFLVYNGNYTSGKKRKKKLKSLNINTAFASIWLYISIQQKKRPEGLEISIIAILVLG